MAFHCRTCDFSTNDYMVMHEHQRRARQIHIIIKKLRRINHTRERKIMRMRIPIKAKRKLIDIKTIHRVNLGGKIYEV
jgi:hypothetical protein